MTVAADDLADISWFTTNRDPTHPGQHGQAAGRIDVGLSIHRHIGLGQSGYAVGNGVGEEYILLGRHQPAFSGVRLYEREPNDAVLVPGGPVETECATTVMRDQHDVVDVEVVHQRVEVALVITESVLTVWSSRVTVADEVNSART